MLARWSEKQADGPDECAETRPKKRPGVRPNGSSCSGGKKGAGLPCEKTKGGFATAARHTKRGGSSGRRSLHAGGGGDKRGVRGPAGGAARLSLQAKPEGEGAACAARTYGRLIGREGPSQSHDVSALSVAT